MQDIGGNVRVNVRRSELCGPNGVTGNVDLQGRGNDVELENVQGQVTIEGSWGGELQFRKLAKPLRFQGSAGRPCGPANRLAKSDWDGASQR